jgi:hypothetical protein
LRKALTHCHNAQILGLHLLPALLTQRDDGHHGPRSWYRVIVHWHLPVIDLPVSFSMMFFPTKDRRGLVVHCVLPRETVITVSVSC